MTAHTTSPLVRFARLERRGVLLGLTAAQLSVIGAAAAVIGIAEYVAGWTAVVDAAPIWLLLAALGVFRAAGRPWVAWLPLLGAWSLRGLTHATNWRTRPAAARERHVLEFPGVRGRITVRDLDDGTATVVAGGETTVVVEVAGGDFPLADADAQYRLVNGWGQVLAWTCRQPDVVRIQVMHRAGPGGGAAVRQWWSTHGVRDSPWAAKVVSGLLADGAAATDRYDCFVVLALKRGSDVHDVLNAFTDILSAAEIRVVRRVASRQLRRILQGSYDLAASSVEDRDCGEHSGVSAMGVEEEWDRLRTDSAWHATYWVSEWPRTEVPSGFLQPMLLAPGMHRTFSLVVEPVPLADAMREIRRAKADHLADAAQRARIGQIEDEAIRAEASDVLRREQDLVAGHGDMRLVALLTVSALRADELDGACAALEAAAARSMCEVRRLVGQQMTAHASATLPLARRVT